MIRLGFKKSEEKEMLGRTIAELQELRAELSSIKEKLSAIIPDQPSGSPCAPAACEAAVSGCGDWAETEITGDNGDVHMLLEEGATLPETGKTARSLSLAQTSCECNTDKEETPAEGCCDGAGGEGEPGLKMAEEGADECAPSGEADGPDLSPGETVPARKDWAVVSFRGDKRPWWKWWGSKNHLVRRSV